MLNKKLLFQGLFVSAILIFSQVTFAGSMRLDENTSTLSFVSIKNGTVAEAHSINKLSGSISDKGELNIKIFLTSVDTNIDIRNIRMNQYVFDSENNPLATITANVAGKFPESGVARVETKGELSMRGVKKTINVSVMIANTGKQILVSSIKPIIINAADYNMEEGVKKLQELAKLSSIATAVPVSFSLTFNK